MIQQAGGSKQLAVYLCCPLPTASCQLGVFAVRLLLIYLGALFLEFVDGGLIEIS